MPVGPYLVQRNSDNAIFLVSGNRVAHIASSAQVKDLQFRLGLGSIRRVEGVFGKRVDLADLVSGILPPPPVPVDPGLAARQWEAALALQKQIADDARAQWEAGQADIRRSTEAQYAANPADFVAYELYRRSLEEEGFTPERASRSDVDIQNLFNVALGLEGSAPLPEGVGGGVYGDIGDPSTATLGKGQFGVNLPTTGSISRSELQSYSPTDLGVLESFLRGGVETGGGFQGINPEDFFTELEEGLIPTLSGQRTQYRL